MSDEQQQPGDDRLVEGAAREGIQSDQPALPPEEGETLTQPAHPE